MRVTGSFVPPTPNTKLSHWEPECKLSSNATECRVGKLPQLQELLINEIFDCFQGGRPCACSHMAREEYKVSRQSVWASCSKSPTGRAVSKGHRSTYSLTLMRRMYLRRADEMCLTQTQEIVRKTLSACFIQWPFHCGLTACGPRQGGSWTRLMGRPIHNLVPGE